MKKIRILFLVIIVAILLTGCKKTNDDNNNDIKNEIIDPINEEIKGEEVMKSENCLIGNTIKVDDTKTLDANTLWNNSNVCENLKLVDNRITLDDITMNGTLETAVFFINPYKELVPSWNVIIDNNSAVTFLFSVGNNEGFSEYYTIGYWKESYKASFDNQEDEFAKVYIDTIVTKKDDIDRFKIKVVFRNSETEITALKNISVTTKLVSDNRNFDTSVLSEKIIDVTPRQQLSVPVIGNSICSPTSLSMIMTYYQHLESQQDVAGIVFDEGAGIYGNWTFNASYPGGFDGLYSRVEYVNNLATIMKYINEDTPLVLSIKTTSISDLEGTIMAYPGGHLIVLIGFKEIEGIWYGVVNDPAEYTDENVRREYKLDQLLNVWRGYIYVVKDEMFDETD